jgi:hypothetical protein
VRHDGCRAGITRDEVVAWKTRPDAGFSRLGRGTLSGIGIGNPDDA